MTIEESIQKFRDISIGDSEEMVIVKFGNNYNDIGSGVSVMQYDLRNDKNEKIYSAVEFGIVNGKVFKIILRYK